MLFYFILNCFSDIWIFISSLEIIKVINPDPNIFLYIPASAAAAAAATVNLNGIRTLLDNGLITFFIKVILFLVIDQVIY